MLFYKFQITCDLQEEKSDNSIDGRLEERRAFKLQLNEMSEALSEGIDGERVKVLIHRAHRKNFQVFVAVDGLKELTVAKLTNLIKNFFAAHNEFGVKESRIKNLTEITAAQFSKISEQSNGADDFDCDYSQIIQELGIDCSRTHSFELVEVICPAKRLSFEKAMRDAKRFIADETFKEEFKRIYDPKNAHRFYGHPVHYKITAGNLDAVVNLMFTLIVALYTNKRIVSRRLNVVSKITEDFYEESELNRIFENAAGGTVVIDLSGERTKSGQFASTDEDTIEFIAASVKRYQRNTLFIFVENVDKPGIAPQVIAKVQDDLHLIELQEGVGNHDMALACLKELMATDQANLATYTDDELLAALGDKLTFRTSDILNVYQKLFNNALKDKIYPAYREIDRVTVAAEVADNDAYADFKEMIGLTEQKALIEQIIAAHRVQKMRLEMKLDKQKAALHMSFTGNPGSAKTTVARLFAQILARDGVLKTGRFVECGRADLVAKYVGWTAKAVRDKFKEARGGVLFIDEAYSLSDGEHSTFGDEAINTIVQEMENHRDDVIVIFAGYPDKMKEFLDRNEGLRSRIAFHVNFPDYTPEELTEIFKLMARRRGYEISAEVAAHCRKLFAHVVKRKNFGNGRFVRNLLEQAWLRQSQRIVTEHQDGTVTRDELTRLTIDDFAVNIDKTFSDNRRLGFAL